MWPYLHSTLCTKNACSRTYISDWRIGQISSGCSSLWVSPWICLHSASAVLLPAYGYGLHTHLPLWFPLPRIARIFAAISFLLPLYIFRIWFACDISAQTRYGIDTATSYVLNYLCLSLDLLFYSCCDCQSPQLYYRSLFLSIVVNSLSTHSVSGCLWQCKNWYKFILYQFFLNVALAKKKTTISCGQSGTPGGNRTHNGPLGVLKNSQNSIKIGNYCAF